MSMAKKKAKKIECVIPGCDVPGCADPAHAFNAAAEKPLPPAETEPLSLADMSDASLEKTFNAFVEQNRQDFSPYKPAIEKLSRLISRLDLLCDGQAGMEIATLDTLRKYNLNRGGSPIPPYCILNIYDARLLVRVDEKNTIDCYRGNINKAQPEIQNLDSNDFWHSSGAENFFRYNLNTEEDSAVFLASVLRIAAMCKATQELRGLDVRPSAIIPPLGKTRDRKP